MSVYERSFRSYWFRQILFCIVFAAAVALCWALGLHGYFSSRINPAASFTIAYVLCLIPVFIKRLWRIFTDRSFSATVTNVSYMESQTFNKEDMRASATTDLYTVKLKMVLDNGSAAKKNIESFEPFYADMWYKVGDRIIYHRGTKFPLIVGGRRFCAYCGDGLKDGEERCHKCGRMNEPPEN